MIVVSFFTGLIVVCANKLLDCTGPPDNLTTFDTVKIFDDEDDWEFEFTKAAQ